MLAAPGCLQVVSTLLTLHSTSQALINCSTALDLDPPSLLLQQLEYLSSVRTQLLHSTIAACKQHFKIISSSGVLLSAANLYLPPRDVAAEELLQDLTQAGKGLQLLSPAFQEFWADEEKCLVLTKVLGVKQADAAAVIGALADLHNSSSSSSHTRDSSSSSSWVSIGEQQLMRHMLYMARHIDLLAGVSGAGLLARVKGAVQLPDKHGVYSSPGSLFFPLGHQFSSLEQELEAAGMRFISSSFAAAASCSSSGYGDVFSHKRMEELLLLLGVKEPDVRAVVKFILQLYEEPSAVATMGASSHMLHVHFLCERWGELSEQLKEEVKGKLLLRVAVSGSSSSSSGDSGSMSSSGSGRGMSSKNMGDGGTPVVYAKAGLLYILPQEGTPEDDLLRVLELGGAKFLAEDYSAVDLASSSSGRGLLYWMQWHLGVRELSTQQVIRHIISAHAHRTELEALCTPKQILHHALYIADHHELFLTQTLQNELQLKQRLLIGVTGTGPSNTVSLLTADNFSASVALYWPERGDGWELSEVLLPEEVVYVAPDYVAEVERLAESTNNRFLAARIKKFFTQQLGVVTLPRVESRELQAAVAAGDRWRPILLMLKERWHSYLAKEQQQLAELLSKMEVC